MNKPKHTENPFGEVIYAYTRAQAIADGVLIDVTRDATEAGFRYPMAITQTAWEDCVAWTDDDSNKQTHQDQRGRLWDVLWMARMAVAENKNASTVHYKLYRVPRDGKTREARLTQLKIHIGPGDQGEPVLTVMLPTED